MFIAQCNSKNRFFSKRIWKVILSSLHLYHRLSLSKLQNGYNSKSAYKNNILNILSLIIFGGKRQKYPNEYNAHIRLTTLTLPNSDSVDGWTSLRILGASRDSVRRALMTSAGPSGDINVVIALEIFK